MGNLKGSRGELEVAKLLAGWWCPFEPVVEDKDVQFVRTPGSGGWLHADGFNACGDIMTNSKRFPFSVEVKREQAWSMQWMLDGKASPVWAWWRQCQRDAERASREPMLWFRQNKRPWLVFLSKRHATSVRGLGSPDAAWPDRLLYQVDCVVVPVLYLGARILAYPPEIFAR